MSPNLIHNLLLHYCCKMPPVLLLAAETSGSQICEHIQDICNCLRLVEWKALQSCAVARHGAIGGALVMYIAHAASFLSFLYIPSSAKSLADFTAFIS